MLWSKKLLKIFFDFWWKSLKINQIYFLFSILWNYKTKIKLNLEFKFLNFLNLKIIEFNNIWIFWLLCVYNSIIMLIIQVFLLDFRDFSSQNSTNINYIHYILFFILLYLLFFLKLIFLNINPNKKYILKFYVNGKGLNKRCTETI